jgi:dATP pyrophosphohydrolase
MWQFIAGGGEDDETPEQAARREAFEEAGLPRNLVEMMRLDCVASIPRDAFPGAGWPDHVYVVLEHCFATDVGGEDLRLSLEHDRVEWLDYEQARSRLTWDSNRNALCELHQRLRRRDTK